MSLALARAIADAVLWEGYLLYPYRATSSKNRIRWQFGVLGPPDVQLSGIAEEPSMHCECLLRAGTGTTLTVHVRFLHLVRRQILRAVTGAAGTQFLPVDELRSGGATFVSFDEAVECALTFGPFNLQDLQADTTVAVEVPAAVDIEEIAGPDGTTVGRVSRTRQTLVGALNLWAAGASSARVSSAALARLSCTLANTSTELAADRDAAVAVSFLGAHLLLEVEGGSFVSLLEPPADCEVAAAECLQRRCWPVLAGAPGETDVMLASPIILYDHPAVAPESVGALFDSTEIDEILTLRVMTLTDEEKAAARATDPAAAAIIDRCESMPPQTLAQLHGVLRDPRINLDDGVRDETPWSTVRSSDDWEADIPTFGAPDAPWWDPGVDGRVDPTSDAVLINGVQVAKGSLVRLRPHRRADAQDLFYAGQEAKVAAVYSDVDDNTHVAVVLIDDPAADLHEWYGRFLYFAPDELEPLAATSTPGATAPATKENLP